MNPNPREKCNFLSLLLFTYTIGIFKAGYKKTIGVEDINQPLRSDMTRVLGDRLERRWKEHVAVTAKSGTKPSLIKVIIQTFWLEYLSLGITLFFQDVFVQLSQTVLLGYYLVYFVQPPTMIQETALWCGSGVVILAALQVLGSSQYIMNCYHYGMKVRVACCCLIYRKALRLSKTALGSTSPGQIVNLLSNDVSRFDYVTICLHYMWVSPFAALIITFILYYEAGYAGIFGIIPILLIVPLQSYTGHLSAIYRKDIAKRTDERVRLMNEIVSGVQVIKMYAWEKPFAKLIAYARKLELKVVIKSAYVRAIYMTFGLFTSRIALFCTLVTMVLTHQSLTPTKVFVFMSFFNIISQSMSSLFVRGVSEISELFVSIKRLETFLLYDEFHEIEHISSSGKETVLALKNVTTKWKSDAKDNALNKVSLNLEAGKLIGVIGPVGSGKSSLLLTILGEQIISSGTLTLNGVISYASQEPWIFSSTIRENILFGLKYNSRRYKKVIKVCGLEKDLEQFPNRDHTLVGDRGASLSGGQKARVNLARALYRKADIYLLDDPLSAVDTHVAKTLYDECINGFLEGKARILVTHQVHHLKNADHIIILNNGSVECEGRFQALERSSATYAQLLISGEESSERPTPSEDEMATSKYLRTISVSSSVTGTMSSTESLEVATKGGVNFVQEESSKGTVKGSLFLKYLFVSKEYFFISFVTCLYVLAQLIASGSDYFVSFWSSMEETRRFKKIQSENFELSSESCIYIYTALIIALFLVALVRSVIHFKLAMKSSQRVHDDMFNHVIKTTMRFFDTNPIGNILTRFSKDLGAIDEVLPKLVLDTAQNLFQVIGCLVLVSIVNPYITILGVLLAAFFFILRKVALRATNDIKRLEGIMAGPVFTHLNATIQGLATIRALKAQAIVTEEFEKRQDYHTGSWFMYISAISAFTFFVDSCCFVFTAFVIYSFFFLNEPLELTASEVGLGITKCLAIASFVQWGVRKSADISNQLMAVERVCQYESLPVENEPESAKTPPNAWPMKGAIRFEGMNLRYDDHLPPVLKDLNIEIKPKEKVGIVGRTGAGKSSLIAALFRLATIEGKIIIDDIDTKDVALDVLRSKISIIPQDPVLFSGTLRYNMDPFEEYNDDVLYKALNDVELKDPSNIINRLENRVMDRGSNYSVGQRQLICLARAIIRSNRILLLDEATANVDPQTDELIQRTIREKFAACTVLTVAHRLNTIIDSDRVLVMDSGSVVEFDHPYILLQNSESVFYQLVMQMDKSMMDHLGQIAKESYENKRSL